MSDEPAQTVPLSMAARAAFLVGFGLVLFSVYGFIGAHQVRAELHTLETAVDRAIPFTAAWVLAYGALYPVVVSPLTVMGDLRVATRAALGLSLLVFASVPFWLLYPVTVPRPALAPHDLLSWGVVMVRWVDPPTNCFPSMHVAEAAFAALLVRRHDPRWGALLLGVTALIWVGSIAIGQHWFVDGLAGIAMAFSVDQLVYRGLPKSAFAPQDRRWHALWIGLYVLCFVACACPWWFGWIDPAQLDGRW